MLFLKTLALALLLSGSVQAHIAAEIVLPITAAAPFEVSSVVFSVYDPADSGLRSFALVCGLVAFALAMQQAIFPRNARAARIRSGQR